MRSLELTHQAYAAFADGNIERVLGMMHPEVRWTETAGYELGGVFEGPEAVLENVFAKMGEIWASFVIDIERLIDGGDVVVMQGHYVAKGKASGREGRAAVAHVLEWSDDKLVRFDQYVDSATINAVL